MWSGGPDAIGSVRPAGKWAQGLTCQTAKTPACHIQCVSKRFLFYFGNAHPFFNPSNPTESIMFLDIEYSFASSISY